MIILISFVGIIIASFAYRSLEGDQNRTRFFAYLFGLIGSIYLTVTTDHLLIFFITWGINNFLLTLLMAHKKNWEAANYSSFLALNNALFGLLFLGCAFFILYLTTGTLSIHTILQSSIGRKELFSALILISLSAFSQSAIYPFHRWLISSLNSPTSISAFMHAGLINGGGFLLGRFAPLFFREPNLLMPIFLVGIISAFIGTYWKLIQSDVKRMLACSTLSQMGFMVAQCGLGLFSNAIAHLFWHGLFKAYQFLAIGTTANEKKLTLKQSPTATQFFLALFCGICGAYGFSLISKVNLYSRDTHLFLLLFTVLAGAQFSLSILQSRNKAKIPFSIFATFASGCFYGWSVLLIEHFIKPLGINQAQPIHLIHILAFSAFTIAWLALVFRESLFKKGKFSNLRLRLYVKGLNASQPHPKTVTANRNTYQF